jgi:hypothetical protein
MIMIAWMLVVATVIVLSWQFAYFHRQKRECEKYPFFELRDEVVLRLVQEGDKKPLLEVYRQINSAVHELHRFDIRFFAGAMASFVHELAENGYRCGFDQSKDWTGKREAIPPLTRQYAQLVIKTARANSFLIRFAMTRLGTRLFMKASIPVAFMRLVKNHPELYRRLLASRDYARARVMMEAAA